MSLNFRGELNVVFVLASSDVEKALSLVRRNFDLI